MADISEVKVSGVTYNIKDNPSRRFGHINVLCSWDGNTENLETINIGGLDYYRIRDGISTNNYLIGEMSMLDFELKQNSLSSDEMAQMMSFVLDAMHLIGHATLYTSTISLNRFFGEMLLAEFSTNMSEEVYTEAQNLINTSNMGTWIYSFTTLFINAPQDISVSAELGDFLYGTSETITIPAGLWIAKLEMGEEFGYQSFPLFPQVIYEVSTSGSEYIDNVFQNMGFMNNETFLVNKTYTGLNSIETYKKSWMMNTSWSSTSYFKENQTVYIKCTMPASSYEISAITATGASGATYSLEETTGNTSSAYIKWYKFYMPNEQVNVSVTCTAVTE